MYYPPAVRGLIEGIPVTFSSDIASRLTLPCIQVYSNEACRIAQVLTPAMHACCGTGFALQLQSTVSWAMQVFNDREKE
jgi:hypothetical protein